jgi:Glu-tRNA(Gln) amidotransferase subunit E-like FAD-binding protein
MHEKQDEREIEEKVLDIVKRKPGLSVNAYMGLLMKELKGRVDGKMLMELIKRYVK